MDNLVRIKNKVLPVVARAGARLRTAFEHQTVKLRRRKDFQDIQLQLDVEMEELLKKELFKLFPRIPFIGEEEGINGKLPVEYWLVDPIDGSRHFWQRNPIFTTNVALMRAGEPVVGVVYSPVMKMMFHAARGSGSFLNRKKIHTSTVTRLEESCLYVELPGKKYRQQNNFTAERVKGLQAVIKLLGSGARVENYRLAWGLSLVANGGFEAYLDFSGTTKPWDICAGIVLVREAGGKIYYQKTQKGFVKVFGTNGKIDKELFNVLK